jgi:DNA polymerase elongation subunit (family B)
MGQTLIELRHDVKGRRDSAAGKARKALDTEQNAIKIAANATSYGIFVEINANDEPDGEVATIHTGAGRSYRVETTKVETPGQFFHPLLATLITGAARLMLAITERSVDDSRLEWAFCDTDSMAIAKPDRMEAEEFYTRVDNVVSWFSDLNPYDFGGSILKVEDVNFGSGDGRARKPLYCWAVSAKRYALFNIDANGQPVLRKASAHGLGHLRAP